MGYIGECLGKARGFFFEPGKAFGAEEKTSTGEAFKYLLTLSVVLAVMTGIIAAGASGNAMVFVFSAAGVYVAIVIGAFIGGLILHLFAYIFGARKGIEQTLKAVFYGSTPGLLLGWIPIVGVIFSLWNVFLEVVGLKVLQKMSTGRAVLAVLTPIIILVTLVVIGFILFFMTLASMGGISPGFMSGFDSLQTGCSPLNPGSGFPFCS